MAPPVRDAWASDPQDTARLAPKAAAVKKRIEDLIRRMVEAAIPRPGARAVAIPFQVGSPGTPLITGTWGQIRLELNREVRLLAVTLTSQTSGSCVLDLLTSDYAGFPTTASICASAKPTLSGATKSEDTTLTGWTVDLADRAVLEIAVDSADGTIDVVSGTLRALLVEPQQRA